MKKCFLVLTIMLQSCCLHAQTLEEWTQQKKMQIRYLLEQIIALQAYGRQVKSGYDILQEELSTIQSIKQRDFHLHDEFFSSLKKVNPNIRKYTKVSGIVLMQAGIVKQCQRTTKATGESGQFSNDELKYLHRVYKGVLDQCLTLIEELSQVIISGQLQLSDDERIDRIDTLFGEMQKHYLFAQHYHSEISILANQRVRERKDNERVRLINKYK